MKDFLETTEKDVRRNFKKYLHYVDSNVDVIIEKGGNKYTLINQEELEELRALKSLAKRKNSLETRSE